MANEFKTFAVGGSANVVTQAAYEALTTILANGFSSGLASSERLNKVWRQSSFVAHCVAQFIADQLGLTIADDGDDTTFVKRLLQAIAKAVPISSNRFYGASTSVWTRGTSITVSSGTTVYTADGLVVSATGASVTAARVAGLLLSVYAAKITGQASVTACSFKKRVESYDAAPLAGQRCTVQCRFKNNSGASITPTLTVKHLDASDVGVAAPWSGASTTDVNAVNLSAVADGATAVLSYTFDAHASSSNGLEVTWNLGNGLNGAAKNVTVSEFDIRVTPSMPVGITESPPIPAFLPVEMDVLRCQRYLPGFAASGSAAGGRFTGAAQNTSQVTFGYTFHTPARVAPTGMVVSDVAHFNVTNAGGNPTFTGFTAGNLDIYGSYLSVTSVAGSPFTANDASVLNATNTAASFYFTGAEL